MASYSQALSLIRLAAHAAIHLLPLAWEKGFPLGSNFRPQPFSRKRQKVASAKRETDEGSQ